MDFKFSFHAVRSQLSFFNFSHKTFPLILNLNDLRLLLEQLIDINCSHLRYPQEKLDILEEHISQLMSEIKKKNRVIQSYVMNIEPGALISEQSDIHKVGSRISPGRQN